MKRRIALVLAILITFLSWPAGVPSAHAAVYRRPDRPSVSCYAAALMDCQKGALLYDKNAFTRMHPASITKMMTALLALEHGRLEDLVTVSAEAASQPGSSMYLKTGDVFSLENLLYGLMLNSGNGAAWAIAEHVEGLRNAFDMMNERAREGL